MGSGLTKGKNVTVLSIDGGGIRGIIPGTLLGFLESKLQLGLAPAGSSPPCLQLPTRTIRPMFAARDINNFYLEHCPKIFPQSSQNNLVDTVTGLFGTVTGPKYDGKYLKTMLPHFFQHYFETKDANGKTRSYDLIDGGVAANNPTLMAITHISKELLMGKFKFVDIKPMESSNMLVLSLGTGVPKQAEKYSALAASKWGLLNWVYNNGAMPLLDVYGDASSDMVDIHVSTLFRSLNNEKNYIRIQDDTLTGDAASLDIATKENMERLVQIGNELLKRPLSRVNLETGRFNEVGEEGTNEAALIRFAKLLSEERKRRHVD
ncbi:phospholipase A 2A [Actinidia rufa]|uniref:Phospholipase A 2A n=1 Tax=Actinidia rufa TaxID=165716 RepID=A0A7J0F561_9ERIC|nr:phospholipase A 2A [Actinidia rufa]